MTLIWNIKSKKVLMGRICSEVDLLNELTSICQKEDIILGRVEAIGAIQKANIGFYDQREHRYHYMYLNQPLEITKLLGNITIKDKRPHIHAHITLADKTGKVYGGHLASGTVVFICEFIFEVYTGKNIERIYNEETGLNI